MMMEVAMKSRVYKNLESKKAMLSLYDTQMSSLNIGYEDLVVNTRFGDTHVVRLGNPDGDPIVLFHGGNSTTPFSLKDFLFLSNDYLLFAPDTIGHPGKSAETVLSAKNMEHGIWTMGDGCDYNLKDPVNNMHWVFLRRRYIDEAHVRSPSTYKESSAHCSGGNMQYIYNQYYDQAGYSHVNVSADKKRKVACKIYTSDGS